MRDVSGELADWAGRWLGDPAERARAAAALDASAGPGGGPGCVGPGGLDGHRGLTTAPSRGPHDRTAAIPDAGADAHQ